MNESRAARHQRRRRWSSAASTTGAGLVLVVLGLTPAGQALATWSAGVAAALPAPLGGAGAFALFITAAVALWEAIALAGALLTGGGEVRAAATGAALALTAGLAGGATVQLSAALTGRWWWAAASLVFAGGLVWVMHAGPAMLARLSGARPLRRPALVERLGALSRRIDVPIESIDELPEGAAATATALVAGAGGSRRVFIAAELVRDWTDEEVAIVVAHEFAHHAHHDLWRTLALDAVILAAGFRAADVLARLVAAPFGVPPVGNLGALPLVALAVSAVWLIATPIRHAVSRRQERRADAFALRLTGSTDAFRTALRRLASKHLAEERPSRLTQWFYHRHPTVAERLAVADGFETRAEY